ncbi:MAG: glutamine--fructose-6-phosphate transaminase (isomerizing) [Clostridiales bacterium]|nr:glutamine--fructose-6-phosphate transaminase (isomerizing) [Clostridiales bacterium]
MCGIVGYIGNKKASPILINGLLRLEYRGYDSAGIATIEEEKISVMKNKGRVNNLNDIEGIDDLKGTIGIAHTRWATHGKPSKENSHPHMDNSNSFAVVHNGIIENYQELRKKLTDKGYEFLSETDTEVIPNLIHYYYQKENDVLKAISRACKKLKGSYAIEVLSKYEPDKMIIARKDSPLVVGKGNGENYIASDIPAILSYTKDFYFLDDNEIVELKRDNITFYNQDLEQIRKRVKVIDWGAAAAEKDGYDDFMLKEIHEQPNAIRETIGAKLDNDKIELEDLNFSKEYLESLNKIYIVACGTAMHAGLVAKTIIEKLCKIPTEVDIASEFRYREPLIDEKTLAIYISQSGETADTIAALKLAKSKGAKTIAISNVIGSSITREADYSVYTHAGPEIAVASTKAYTSQVVLLSLLAIYFAEILESSEDKLINKLKKSMLELPSQVEEILKDISSIKRFAKKIYKETDMFFLGRGTDYAVALEGSLKLKEISYIHSESYAAGELKHGPIALIENGITVVSIITNKDLMDKSLSNIQEVITRGAKIMMVTNQEMDNKNFDCIIKIPKTNPLISPILSVVPLQVLAYYISKEKGLDVDKPRNLAKSVTVE